jgi:protein arginine kinase activator
MKCQACGENEATVHYKEIKSDEVRELHLCAACAEEKGFLTSSEGEGPPPNLLGGMADDQFPPGGEAGPGRCPSCGLTYADFKASARLGCADCYATFRAPLVPLFRRIHGSDRYMGKAPAGGPGEAQGKARRIRALKRRLETCVEEEEFEEAARLRDEIRRLEEDGE